MATWAHCPVGSIKDQGLMPIAKLTSATRYSPEITSAPQHLHSVPCFIFWPRALFTSSSSSGIVFAPQSSAMKAPPSWSSRPSTGTEDTPPPTVQAAWGAGCIRGQGLSNGCPEGADGLLCPHCQAGTGCCVLRQVGPVLSACGIALAHCSCNSLPAAAPSVPCWEGGCVPWQFVPCSQCFGLALSTSTAMECSPLTPCLASGDLAPCCACSARLQRSSPHWTRAEELGCQVAQLLQCTTWSGMAELELPAPAPAPQHSFVTVCQPQSALVPAPEQLSWLHATPGQACHSLSCLALRQHPAFVTVCSPMMPLSWAPPGQVCPAGAAWPCAGPAVAA